MVRSRKSMDEKSTELLECLRKSWSEADLAALRKHCLRVRNPTALTTGLLEWRDHQSDPEAAADAVAETSALLSEMGDLEAAKELLGGTFQRQPLHEPSVAALRKLLLAQGDAAGLADVLSQHARAMEEVEGDPLVIAELHLEVGHLWRDQLQRPDRAVEHYRQAVDFDAAQRGAIQAARAIYEEAREWESVTKLLSLEADSFPKGEKKATLLVELSALLMERMDDFQGSYQALHEAVTSLPEDLGIKHRLATLLLERSDRAPEAPESSKYREEAADVLTTMAEACEDEYALPYTEAALDAAPDHERALHLYEQVARRTGHEYDIPARWVAYVEYAPEGPRARPLRLKLARAYLEAGQPEGAEVCLAPLVAAGDEDAKQLLSQVPRARLDVAQNEELTPVRGSQLPQELLRGGPDESVPPFADSSTVVTSRETPLTEEEARLALLSRDDAIDVASVPTRQDFPDDLTPVQALPHTGIDHLRDEMHRKLRLRDRKGAADVAEQLLTHAPLDADALMTVENVYRSTHKHGMLQDVLMRLGSHSEISLEGRLPRLREAIQLYQKQLKDPDGAINAMDLLVRLQPGNREAFEQLCDFTQKQERWEDLARAVERRLTADIEPSESLELYKQLLTVHRDKRNAPQDAVRVLNKLRELEPEEDHDRALLELHQAAGQHEEVLLLLEERLTRTSGEEKVDILQAMAEVHQEHLSAPERAYELAESALSLAPDDERPLALMERIDEEQQRFDRLVTTLQHRAERAPDGAATDLYTRIGRLAHEELQNVELTVTAYDKALGLTPARTALWEEARDIFDELDMDAEFDKLIEREIDNAPGTSFSRTLRRQLAARKALAGEVEAAIDALQALLDAEPNNQATRADLLDLLAQDGHQPERMARELANLADATDEEGDARDLRMQRVSLFRGPIDDPKLARDEVKKVLSEHEDDEEALDQLIEICEELHDDRELADAAERRLKRPMEPDAELELSRKLAELAMDTLSDDTLALTALRTWVSLAPRDREAHERILPYLRDAREDAELTDCLDALGALTEDDAQAGAFIREAARLASDSLKDLDGAWQRLVPLVTEGSDAEAAAQLRELAERANWGSQLGEIYVSLAQRSENSKEQRVLWVTAADGYDMAGDWENALEATLRALALQMDDGQLLDRADALATRAEAWPRLANVYNSLARHAPNNEVRVQVLVRHAKLLDEAAKQPGEALDRMLLACHVAPADDHLVQTALRQAEQAGRTADVLTVYERRAELAPSIPLRVRAFLTACTLTVEKLRDPARATGYLTRAVASTMGSTALMEEIEREASVIDQANPPMDGRGMQHALTEVYKVRAQELANDPFLATASLQRAARLFAGALEDDSSAYLSLMEAYELKPDDEPLMEELIDAARRAGAVGDLVSRLRPVVERTLDPDTASLALEQLGVLLSTDLKRPQDAAEVFRRLLTLRPEDLKARSSLLACLRTAKRHQELLVAVNQQLGRTGDPGQRLELLREAARCWQDGLKNRFEALEAWQKVLQIAPDDPEALEAIGGLKPSAKLDEGQLLEDKVVVTPEDLSTDVPEPLPPQEAPSPVEIPRAPLVPNLSVTIAESAPPIAEDDPEPTTVGLSQSPAELRRAHLAQTIVEEPDDAQAVSDGSALQIEIQPAHDSDANATVPPRMARDTTAFEGDPQEHFVTFKPPPEPTPAAAFGPGDWDTGEMTTPRSSGGLTAAERAVLDAMAEEAAAEDHTMVEEADAPSMMGLRIPEGDWIDESEDQEIDVDDGAWPTDARGAPAPALPESMPSHAAQSLPAVTIPGLNLPAIHPSGPPPEPTDLPGRPSRDTIDENAEELLVIALAEDPADEFEELESGAIELADMAELLNSSRLTPPPPPPQSTPANRTPPPASPGSGLDALDGLIKRKSGRPRSQVPPPPPASEGSHSSPMPASRPRSRSRRTSDIPPKK